MRIILACSLVAAALGLAGCSDDGGSAASFDGSVEVDDDTFDPGEATVDAGSEVHFEVSAQAQRPHTVTIHKAGDDPNTLLLDETVSAGDDAHFEFEEAGTYHVWCKFHGTMTSGMAMLVTVE